MDNDAFQATNVLAPTVEGLLRAVAEAGRVLVESQDFSAGLSAAIRALGELTDFDRAYAFQFDPTADSYRLIADWTRPPWPPYATDPMWQSLRVADFPEIHTEFAAGRVWKSHQPERTGANAANNDKAQTKSDALVPVFVQGSLWGCVGFDRCSAIHDFTEGEINVLRTASALIAAAVERERAEKHKIEAVAREREHAAQQRAEELERMARALQETIDSFGKISDLDQLVPVVLQIVARTLGAISCAVYEHKTDIVFLKFWFVEGRVLHPHQLLEVDEEKFGLIRRLAAGFTVPVDYLGMSVVERTRAVIVNHDAGTSVPEFDTFARNLGWDLELNVPIVSNSRAIGALCVFRNKSAGAYTMQEIRFAESLSAQLAMAILAKDFATKAQNRAIETVIAREREEAAQHRAAELARANATVSRSLAAVSQSTDFDDTLEKIFLEIVAAANASVGQLFCHDEKANTLSTIVWLDSSGYGRGICPDSPPKLRAAFDADITPVFRLCVETKDIVITNIAHLTPEQAAMFWPGTLEWHLAQGREAVCAIPILVGQRPIGLLCLAWKKSFSLSAEQRELLIALSNQAAMVMQLRELADAQRSTSILQERTRFAGQIHDTLAQGFTGTLLHLEALRVRVSRGERVTVDELQGVRKIAALGLAEARRSALAIRPLALDGRDISTALQQLTERSAVPGLLDCRWSLSGIPRPLSSIADEALLNIAHEAVSNAIRHAEASNIHITLAFDPDGVSLRVQDDGIGFDTSDSHQRGHTFGLRSMRERAVAVGGELNVTSKHGEGTAIIVHLRTA